MNHSTLVALFIDQIWNKRAFENLDDFLHPQFKDYSLPKTLTQDKEGTKKWILNTGNSFEHHTLIETQVTEGDLSIVRVRMQLKHIGSWRGIEPTGIELSTTGYRQFQIREDKIIAHWALIDGERIENELNKANKGCSIVK